MDLSKARKGDRVTIVLDDHQAANIRIGSMAAISINQIIAIEPAPFCWDDVRPGMAFNLCGYKAFYCFMVSKDRAQFYTTGPSHHFGSWNLDNVIERLPDEDIKVD